jgi:ABC-type nitrate/sulfonate/bicarbonate transport system ATPase subunit
MIQLENVNHHFDGQIVFTHLNFSLEKNQIHALIGKTGSGKTLILRLLASLSPLQAGQITNSANSIGFVFQQNSFFPWLTLRESLELTFQFKVEEVFQDIKKFRLETYLDKYPHELSGGTLQKFNLLRAFVGRPDLLLLDEPFSHLDIVQREELHHFLIELWSQKKPSMVLVTHDIDEAIKLSHKISFLSGNEKRITASFETANEEKSQLYNTLYNLLKVDLE